MEKSELWVYKDKSEDDVVEHDKKVHFYAMYCNLLLGITPHVTE